MVVLNSDAYGFIFEDRDEHAHRYIAFNDESEGAPMDAHHAQLIESLLLMRMRQLRTRIISVIAGEVNNEQVRRSFHRRVYRNHANNGINNTLDSIRTSIDFIMNDHLDAAVNAPFLAHTITSNSEPSTEPDTETDVSPETLNTHPYRSHDELLFITPPLAQRLERPFDSSNPSLSPIYLASSHSFNSPVNAFVFTNAFPPIDAFNFTNSSDSFTSFISSDSSDSSNDSAPSNASDDFDFTNVSTSSDSSDDFTNVSTSSDTSDSSDSSDSLSSEDITIDYNSILNTS